VGCEVLAGGVDSNEDFAGEAALVVAAVLQEDREETAATRSEKGK